MPHVRIIIWSFSVASLLLVTGCFSSADPLDSGGNTTIETALGLDGTQVASATPAPACAQFGQPASDVHLSMLQALNDYRAENGLKPLVYSKRLEAAANGHVQDLYLRKFFDHLNPDGKNPGQRALDAGFCHRYVGENIAAGQVTVQAVMQAWKNSPGHNANMLEPDYVYVGMGFFIDPTGRPYWGQEFAYDVPQ